jgi:hypothetical protein
MDDEQEESTPSTSPRSRTCSRTRPRAGSGNIILGLLARLSLVALHAQLDEGYTFKTRSTAASPSAPMPEEQEAQLGKHAAGTRAASADEDGYIMIERTLPPPNYTSPKFVECARASPRVRTAATSSFASRPRPTSGSARSWSSTASPASASPSSTPTPRRRPTASASPASSTASQRAARAGHLRQAGRHQHRAEVRRGHLPTRSPTRASTCRCAPARSTTSI